MKWRKIKKRIKQKEIPNLIGMKIECNHTDGTTIGMIIEGVKVKPMPPKSVNYSFIGHTEASY